MEEDYRVSCFVCIIRPATLHGYQVGKGRGEFRISLRKGEFKRSLKRGNTGKVREGVRTWKGKKNGYKHVVSEKYKGRL